MATSKQSSWQPNWAVAPGEILLEALDERGMSQSELARRMNRPLKTVNEIVKGKAAITPETAIQLEMVLGIPSSIWNNLEGHYRVQLAKADADQELQRQANWVDRFPIQDMIKRRVLSKGLSKADQLAEILRFFGVSSPAAWERYWRRASAAFRQSPSFTPSPEAVTVWLRLGEQRAAEIECAPFDAAKLERALPALRALSRKKPLGFWHELVEILRGCGVALVLTREVRGTHLSGATRWVSSGKVLVQLSLRHHSDDQFWFALFHELGHVLRGSKRQTYLDADTQPPALNEDEAAADQFARNQLIPPGDYRRIIAAPEFTVDLIREVAERIGVSPGIVVGRLQRDGRIKPAALNYLKEQFRWWDDSAG